MEIIAYHGWGFSDGFWNPWKKILPKNVNFKAASRGYFFKETNVRFSDSDSTKILFLHSYGLHWCPEQQLEEAECIVIFNSFKSFLPEKEADRKMHEEVLDKMISAFRKEPEKVLKKFYENTFYPKQVPFKMKEDFDESLLLEDLESLTTSQFTPDSFKEGKPIISVDGGNDKILGKPRGKIFTELTKRDAVYHFIKEAGHALPITHSSDCWSFINAMIPIFRKNGNYRK